MQLRVTSSLLSGATFDLNGDYFTIGREPDNSIQLEHSSVSKHHGILKIDGEDVQLMDLHSTNGIVINGKSCIVAHLRDGDKLLLGEVELCFEGERKAETQRMPLPLLVKPDPALPAQSVPPKPAIIDSDSAATPKRKFGLSAVLRRTESRDEPVAPPPPPTKEAIHDGLAETLGKMGIEMPKPPPLSKPSPKPVALPPAPKPVSQTPKSEIRLESAPPVAPVAVLDLPLKQPRPVKIDETLPEPPTNTTTSRSKAPWIFFAGIATLTIGYLLGFSALKFVGLLGAVAGLFSIIFSLKFGSLIAPPKNRPPS